MKEFAKKNEIEVVDFIILALIGWKIYNNSFSLTIINGFITGEQYADILMFLGIVRLWYYYKENTKLTVIMTVLLLGSRFLFSFNKIHSMTMLIVVLAAVAYRMNYAKVCKLYVVTAIIPAIIKCLGVGLGLIADNYDNLNMNGTRAGKVLHCMGYSDHNALPLVIFGASLALIYLAHESSKKRAVYLILVIFHAIIYYLTDSRTTFLIILFIMFLDEFMRFLEYCASKGYRVCKLIKNGIEFMMLLAPTISMVLSMNMVLYVNHRRNMGDMSSNTMISRFLLASVILANNNIKLFNQPNESIFEVKGNYDIMLGGTAFCDSDNVWICAFLYGLPFFLLFIVAFQYSAVRAYKRNNIAALFVLTAYALMGLMENIGTSNTRGMLLYMPFAILATYKGVYSMEYLKTNKNSMGVIMLLTVISIITMITIDFASGLFILTLIILFLWEQIDTYENTNY